MLKAVASRLSQATSADCAVARLGGDEFALFLPQATEPEEIALFAECVLNALKVPFEYEGREHDSRASIGWAVFPRDAEDAAQLLKDADIALYEAKAHGRGCAIPYRAEMRHALEDQMRTVRRARRALSQDRVRAHYQPMIDLATNRVVGFEALLRWKGEEGALLMPADIACAFNDRDLGAALGRRMFENIVADMRHWARAGVDFGHIALNTSEADYCDPEFADNVLAILAHNDIPARRLEIEVTENIFLGSSADKVLRHLEMLAAAGVRISLDDFGTGFASLTHLKRYPVSSLKIDRSFVRDALEDPNDAAIVRALIGLGHSLGKNVVAEGVETRAQAEFLSNEGCPQAQGYLYSRAVESAEVAALAGSSILRVNPGSGLLGSGCQRPDMKFDRDAARRPFDEGRLAAGRS